MFCRWISVPFIFGVGGNSTRSGCALLSCNTLQSRGQLSPNVITQALSRISQTCLSAGANYDDQFYRCFLFPLVPRAPRSSSPHVPDKLCSNPTQTTLGCGEEFRLWVPRLRYSVANLLHLYLGGCYRLQHVKEISRLRYYIDKARPPLMPSELLQRALLFNAESMQNRVRSY